MHVEDAIRHRRSVRHYLPDTVPVTDLREMLSVATLAPSIGNRQMWRFILITDENLRHMLARLVERQIDDMASWPEFLTQSQRIRALRDSALHFVNAPVVICVINQGYRSPIDPMLVEHGKRSTEVEDQFSHPELQSIGGMIAYLTLLAEERGYGTCWITDALIAQKDLQAALEMKAGEKLAALVTLGKPADHPVPKPRKAIDELIEWR